MTSLTVPPNRITLSSARAPDLPTMARRGHLLSVAAISRPIAKMEPREGADFSRAQTSLAFAPPLANGRSRNSSAWPSISSRERLRRSSFEFHPLNSPGL
jgi:hypothetical protein